MGGSHGEEGTGGLRDRGNKHIAHEMATDGEACRQWWDGYDADGAAPCEWNELVHDTRPLRKKKGAPQMKAFGLLTGV